jgi:hypothetical protein
MAIPCARRAICTNERDGQKKLPSVMPQNSLEDHSHRFRDVVIAWYFSALTFFELFRGHRSAANPLLMKCIEYSF